MQRCWSLYNKQDKLQIDDLRPDQVRTILLAISSDKMSDWYACQEGDLHWQSITDISEFYEDVRSAKGSSYLKNPSAEARELATPKNMNASGSKTSVTQAPVSSSSAARRPLFEEAPAGSAEEKTLALETVAIRERRTARRYVRNLLFRATVDGLPFECETKDVSMSGLSLKQKLPATGSKAFRAELSLNGTVVKVLVSRISDIQLKILEAEAWHVIRQWIVNW